MQEILITSCCDSRVWYSHLVGMTVPFLRDTGYEYISRAPDGYSNVVPYCDGELVDAVKYYGDEDSGGI